MDCLPCIPQALEENVRDLSRPSGSQLHPPPLLSFTAKVKWKTAPCLQALLNNGLIFLPPIIALDKYQVCRIII